jgi:chromosome segregation ATPase
VLNNQFLEWQRQHELIKIKNEKTQHEYDEIKSQHQTQTAELTALKQIAMELKLSLKTKDERITFLEESLTRANEKIETLRHDSQFVLQEKASLEGQLKQMNTILSSKKIAALA